MGPSLVSALCTTNETLPMCITNLFTQLIRYDIIYTNKVCLLLPLAISIAMHDSLVVPSNIPAVRLLLTSLSLTQCGLTLCLSARSVSKISRLCKIHLSICRMERILVLAEFWRLLRALQLLVVVHNLVELVLSSPASKDMNIKVMTVICQDMNIYTDLLLWQPSSEWSNWPELRKLTQHYFWVSKFWKDIWNSHTFITYFLQFFTEWASTCKWPDYLWPAQWVTMQNAMIS